MYAPVYTVTRLRPDPTTNYRMLFCGGFSRNLSGCGLTDADVAGEAFEACITNYGPAQISSL